MTRNNTEVWIPNRLRDITSFIVMDVLEKAHEMARKGVNVIHLEVGEPDFDTPQCVKEATCKALQDGHTHYTHSLGMIELREAVCEHYSVSYGVSVNPGQVVITSGTSPAMFALCSVEFGSRTSRPQQFKMSTIRCVQRVCLRERFD